MAPRPAFLIAPILALALSAPALAQPPAGGSGGAGGEFRMDQSGNWVQVGAPMPGTDEAVIAQARHELAQDRPADAHRTIDAWIERNDRSSSPYLASALVIRADALTAQGNEYDALYDYERAIKEFPATQSFVTAVERELDIGVRYVTGLNRKFLGARILPSSDIGEELLIRVQERMPGARIAERAGIELADYYYREHDLNLAVEAYDLFIENYPSSTYKQRAMQRRIYATIARFKGPRYDGSALIDAKILTRRYANLYPADAQKAGLDDGLLTRLDESAAQEMLETANWYLKRKDDVSARLILRRLVRQHPKTSAAQQALTIITEHRWTIQPGTDTAKKPAADPDFIRGEKLQTDSVKPDTQSDKQPESPADPSGRAPPVELNRRKPPAVPQPAQSSAESTQP